MGVTTHNGNGNGNGNGRHGANGAGPLRLVRAKTVPENGPPASTTSAEHAFVGRDEELGRLRAILAGDGREPALVVVAGEPGIGKSRLVAEAIAPYRGRGVLILRGACPEAGGRDLPLGPLRESLRQLVPMSPRSDGRPPLVALATGLAGSLSGSDDGGAALEPVIETMLALTRSQRVLLTIEDLQWADPATLAFVEYVAGNVPAGRITILATHTPSPVAADPRLLGTERLAERPGSAHLGLDVLDPAAIAAFVEQAWGPGTEAVVLERIRRRSGGIPRYLVHMLDTDDRSGRTIPRSLVRIIEARLTALDEPMRRAIDILALVTRPLSTDEIAAVAADAESDLRASLSEAAAMGLVIDDAGWRLRAGPVRDVARSVLPARRIRSLSAALARSMRARADATSAGHRWDALAAAARHAAAADETIAGLDAHIAAAADALVVGEARVAAAQVTRALRIVDADPSATDGVDVGPSGLIRLAARSYAAAGDPERALGILEGNAAAGDAALATERVLGRIDLLVQAGRATDAAAIAVEALDAVDGSGSAAVIEAALVLARLAGGDEPLALEAARPTPDIAPASADGGAVLIDVAIGAAAARSGDDIEAIDALTRAASRLIAARPADRGLHAATGELVAGGLATWTLGWALLEVGGSGSALRLAEALLRRPTDENEASGPHADAGCGRLHAIAGAAAFALGRWPDAARHIHAGRRCPDRTATTAIDAIHGRILTGSGRFRRAAEVLERAERGQRHAADAWIGRYLALANAEAGRAQGKRGLVRAAVSRTASSSTTEPSTAAALEMHALWLAAEADPVPRGRREASGRGRRSTSRWQQAALERAEAALASVPEAGTDSYRETVADWCRAEIARLRGDDDADGWDALADAWARHDRPLAEAEARFHAGRAATDEVAAGQRYVAAHDTARRLSARPLAWRIERAAHAVGIELAGGSRGGADDPARDDRLATSLTPREQQVAGLIATGASNREIATELTITEKTASVHVSNILAKLGVDRRGEVAALMRHDPEA